MLWPSSADARGNRERFPTAIIPLGGRNGLARPGRGWHPLPRPGRRDALLVEYAPQIVRNAEAQREMMRTLRQTQEFKMQMHRLRNMARY